ncbi:hypothetical protein [Mameliella sediminis]|uniref:hypothetical protein n=1 Tax=Mameliella sediminis TaxID=2836866 RepID=UPI001C445D9F|nr:hypothetical protein [Mameliella sediminis]MBV7393934.1 hypothetical protein [Mameliella sediminis]
MPPIRWFTYAAVLASVALLVAGVNRLPPLTQGGLPRTGSPPPGLATAPADPALWCRSNLTDVDCACFAQKAGEVMSTAHEPVQGMAYANRWDLARAQAGQSC